MTPPDTPSIVAVCIATFRRPNQLKLLLKDLAQQELSPIAPLTVTIIIADNDAEETGRVAIEEAQAYHESKHEYPHELHYIVVPERGVVNARNASVEKAAQLGADWMAFIDDDERPSKRWLSLLLETARQTGASAVAGPVPPQFSFEPPSWYTGANLHISQSHETGAKIHYFGTGNVLIKTSALRDVQQMLGTGANPLRPFDKRFNHSGGEDTYLSLMLTKSGHNITWCEAAVATTEVPTERTDLRWVLIRQFNLYRNYVRAKRLASDRYPWMELAKVVISVVMRLTKALFKTLIGVLCMDRVAIFMGAHIAVGAIGKIAGWFDHPTKGWWD